MLIILIFLVSLISHILFSGLIIIIASLMLKEWYDFTNSSRLDLLIGLLLIAISMACLILLHQAMPNFIIFIYLTTIWLTDSFAMIGGKFFKGRKLAPYISPKKTWSGFITGTITAVMVICLINYNIEFCLYHELFKIIHPGIFAFIISITCQISDLLISIFKRKHNVKDSGNIIPGHGGVLDRFDSMILTNPLLFLIFSNSFLFAKIL